MLDALIAFDKKIFIFVQEYLHNPIFDFWMPIITNFDYLVWKIPIWKVLSILFLLYLAIWGGKKGKIIAGLVLIVFILSDQLSSNVFKPLFSRMRPYVVFTHLSPLVESAPKYSFPSTHASNIFAVTVLLSYYYRRYLSLNLLIAFMISFSRVYVGVHYPSDIVAGAILGIGCSFLIIMMEKLIGKKIKTVPNLICPPSITEEANLQPDKGESC